jgi:chromosome segregation ATPase
MPWLCLSLNRENESLEVFHSLAGSLPAMSEFTSLRFVCYDGIGSLMKREDSLPMQEDRLTALEQKVAALERQVFARHAEQGRALSDVQHELTILLGLATKEVELTNGLRTEVSNLRDDMNQRFDQHDRRFDQHDRRFDQHDQRFDQHDRRFDQHDRRFDHHDQQFSGINQQLGRMERLLTEILARLPEKPQHP